MISKYNVVPHCHDASTDSIPYTRKCFHKFDKEHYFPYLSYIVIFLANHCLSGRLQHSIMGFVSGIGRSSLDFNEGF